jgi:hypothetical protein
VATRNEQRMVVTHRTASGALRMADQGGFYLMHPGWMDNPALGGARSVLPAMGGPLLPVRGVPCSESTSSR